MIKQKPKRKPFKICFLIIESGSRDVKDIVPKANKQPER